MGKLTNMVIKAEKILRLNTFKTSILKLVLQFSIYHPNFQSKMKELDAAFPVACTETI